MVLLGWPSLQLHIQYVEIVYCMFSARRLNAILFASSFKLIGWFDGSHVFDRGAAFVLVTCMSFLRYFHA